MFLLLPKFEDCRVRLSSIFLLPILQHSRIANASACDIAVSITADYNFFLAGFVFS